MIKQAAEAVGVHPDTLRAWDRRHGIGGSARSENGYRLYSETDVERLRTLRRLMQRGLTVAQAVEMLHSTPSVLGGLPEPTAMAQGFIAGRISAVEISDWVRTGGSLMPFARLMDEWFLPALRLMAVAWSEGRLPVARQHELSFELTRQFMYCSARCPVPDDAPAVLLGIPEGSRHTLGALAFSVSAAEAGIAATYLADMPVPGWQHALADRRVRAVALAVPSPEDVPAARRLLRALAEPGDVLLTAGGPAHDEVADLAVPLGHGNAEAAANLHAALTRFTGRRAPTAASSPARPAS